MISSTNGQVCSGVPSVFLPSFLPSFRNRLGFPRASRWRTTRGDLETFRRYVDSGHSVLRRVGTGASSLQLCSDQAAFVFGGPATGAVWWMLVVKLEKASLLKTLS